MVAEVRTAVERRIIGVGLVWAVRVTTGGQRVKRARVPQHVGIVNDAQRKHAQEPCGLGGVEALGQRDSGAEHVWAARS